MAGARRSPVGLIGSVVIHAGIIGATLFTFAHKLDVTQESAPIVPVELVTIAAKTNLTPTVKVRPKVPPKEEEPVTPPEPQKAETPPPPQEQPQPEKSESAPPKQKPLPEKTEAPPVPKPVEAPPPPPDAVAPKPEVKPPPPAPKPKPAPKVDIDNVMALLDKRAPAQKSSPNARVADRNIRGFGPQSAMTMELQDALRSQIQQCWSPPVGAPHPEDLVVDFDLFLNQDGSVAQPPQLTGNSASATSNPYTRAAAEAARRAIYECAPYKLPQDKYAQWREINPFHFDPRQMMGD
jgi:outer membrane biosynthesis protein TonB